MKRKRAPLTIPGGGRRQPDKVGFFPSAGMAFAVGAVDSKSEEVFKACSVR